MNKSPTRTLLVLIKKRPRIVAALILTGFLFGITPGVLLGLQYTWGFELSVSPIYLPHPFLSSHVYVPIETKNSVFILKAVINGTEADFLIDTGASKTFISPELAKKAGVVPGSQTLNVATIGEKVNAKVKIGYIEHIKVGPTERRNMPVGIMETIQDIEGILGMDFLGCFALQLDPRKSTLKLLIPKPQTKDCENNNSTTP